MIILVPKGAEYQAVCRGLPQNPQQTWRVIPIPAGTVAGVPYLRTLQQQGELTAPDRILLMGLCGSLQSTFQVGDSVLYKSCLLPSQSTWRESFCDSEFLASLQKQLSLTGQPVRGLTSDRLISQATEKRQLGQQFKADVVDMEGYPLLEFLQINDFQVAIVRVVSDDVNHDIPDLSTTFDAKGDLQVLPLIGQFLRHPIAAARLISGSMKGLQALTEIASRLGDR